MLSYSENVFKLSWALRLLAIWREAILLPYRPISYEWAAIVAELQSASW